MPCATRDQTVIVTNRNGLLNGLNPQKPKHSFSIDALVGNDSSSHRKDIISPSSSPSSASAPSPSSGNKSLSPPQPSSIAFSHAALHPHQLPRSDLLRYINNYPSGPHAPAPHFVTSHHHHPHHPHPMALSMINSIPRTNNSLPPDFYNNVNVNPGFGHWSNPYMRHAAAAMMPSIHGK